MYRLLEQIINKRIETIKKEIQLKEMGGESYNPFEQGKIHAYENVLRDIDKLMGREFFELSELIQMGFVITIFNGEITEYNCDEESYSYIEKMIKNFKFENGDYRVKLDIRYLKNDEMSVEIDIDKIIENEEKDINNILNYGASKDFFITNSWANMKRIYQRFWKTHADDNKYFLPCHNFDFVFNDINKLKLAIKRLEEKFTNLNIIKEEIDFKIHIQYFLIDEHENQDIDFVANNLINCICGN